MLLSVIHTIFSVLGALALFVYGMKLLSESLQNLAGERMRYYLSNVTSNKWQALLIGFITTGLIQSSSASTVMLIGFVNAGLITVVDSIALVLGANIGTTLTSWLLTFFGFSINISKLVLPLMALAIPMHFVKKTSYRSLAEFIFGFSLLFIGLQFLRDAMPPIDAGSTLVNFLASSSDRSGPTLLVFGLVGVLITLVIQSSSATIALTTVLLADGFFSFEVAAALILGENVGTTGTANLAAVFANRNGKRTALIHFLFNLFGVLLVIPVFSLAVQGVESLASLLLGGDTQALLMAPLKVSLFHSLFNLLNATIWINFTPLLGKLSYWIIPPLKDEKVKAALAYKDSFISSSPEISVVQAVAELQTMSLTIERMFHRLPQLLMEKNEEKFAELLLEMKTQERVIDRVEQEVNDYIARLSENKLSEDASKLVNAIAISVNNLESMADVCYKVARTIEKKNEHKAWFTQEQRDNLNELAALVQKSLTLMQLHLSSRKPLPLLDAERNEAAINLLRFKLIDQNMLDLQLKTYPVVSGNYYQQMITYYEKIGDHAINVVEAIHYSMRLPKAERSESPARGQHIGNVDGLDG